MTTKPKHPRRKDWMSDDQWYCANMLAEWRNGWHHVNWRIHDWGSGICINCTNTLSTFDFCSLTRLVFLAHDRVVRVEIGSSGPRMVRIVLHRRNARTGSLFERHPTIEEALKLHRLNTQKGAGDFYER